MPSESIADRIIWLRTWVDDRSNRSGCAWDGELNIGKVDRHEMADMKVVWRWGLGHVHCKEMRGRCYGDALTKEEAKAALVACYERLVALDPGHHARGLFEQRRTESYSEAWLEHHPHMRGVGALMRPGMCRSR